jgi:hypothetical protein
MLSEIAAKGADALDLFLEDEQDREVLYVPRLIATAGPRSVAKRNSGFNA